MENKRRNIVHVNPSFSCNQTTWNGVVPTRQMYLNRNFKGIHNDLINSAIQNSATHRIHINPKLLQVSRPIPENLHPIFHNSLSSERAVVDNRSLYIVNNKNKLVKAPALKINSMPTALVQEPKLPVKPTSRVTKKPSYSFIRKNTTAPSNKCSTSDKLSKLVYNTNVWKKKLDSSPVTSYGSTFIRKRKSFSGGLSKPKQKKNNSQKYKLNNQSRVVTTQTPCVNKSISHNKLTSHKNNIPHVLKNISQSVLIGGEKYIVNNNMLHRVVKSSHPPTMKLKQVKKVNLCGVTYIRKSQNVFVMDNRIQNAIQKRKKINITCPVFRRLGVCIKHNEGKCPLVHDSKNISICQKFLKGICTVDGCHLSHQVILEKMPTCKFFLEGCCVRETCPYLHVKVNQSAKICLQFLNGYCEAGVNCDNKHINICPNFYKYSKCDKAKCPHPHKTLPKTREPQLSDNCAPSPSYSKAVFVATQNDQNHPKTMRYFEDNHECPQNNTHDNVLYKGRSKLGDLPSFISLS